MHSNMIKAYIWVRILRASYTHNWHVLTAISVAINICIVGSSSYGGCKYVNCCKKPKYCFEIITMEKQAAGLKYRLFDKSPWGTVSLSYVLELKNKLVLTSSEHEGTYRLWCFDKINPKYHICYNMYTDSFILQIIFKEFYIAKTFIEMEMTD